jgi:hypothetical protein
MMKLLQEAACDCGMALFKSGLVDPILGCAIWLFNIDPGKPAAEVSQK